MDDTDNEIFDLNTLHEYELLTNDDGSIAIQDNCVLIKHNESKVVKMLPLTEDVLDALGLTMVIDENDVKDTNNTKETTETIEKQENKVFQSTIEGTEDAKVPEKDGTITIVFTDDEDALQMSASQVATNKHTNPDALQWSNPMVFLLLDLYEKNQQRFYTNGYKHRHIWKEIHREMCKKYPELQHWNERNIQSKFNGLKRTFKGALDYFKDNLHTTKWPFFERMQFLMAKSRELQQSSSKEENSNSWQNEWTHLLLDVMEKSLTESPFSGFWSEIREKVIQTEPGFERLTVTQVQAKFTQLQNAFKLCKETGCKPMGELKDETIYEKLSKILNEEIADDAIKDPDNCKMDVDLEPEDNTSLDRSTVLEKSAASPLTRGPKKNVLSGPNAIRPGPHKVGAVSAWSGAATALLLAAYAETRRALDQTGPRFWTRLAATLTQKLPYRHVDATNCEQKIQTLFLKYKALLRSDPGLEGEASRWPYFTKMHQIFGPESVQWPDKVIELLLNLYQAQIPRLESGKNPGIVWAEISDGIIKVHASEEFTADSCRKKMGELKQKYCRLLNDDEAAKAWPFQKRMSEVFTPHLWSKSNVHLLLRLYQSLSARWGHHGWQALSEHFNAASVSSVASATQCRTELRALIARYRNELAKEDGFGEWPFFQKMHEIFGGDESKMAPLYGVDENAKGHMELYLDVTPTAEIKSVLKEEFIWSEDSTKQLLELYESHQPLFGKMPRRAVWLRIDRQLAKIHPLYRPGNKGHGGWLKYLEIRTKYMDIKEQRCTEKDWPFFQVMEEIFNNKKKRRESDSVSEESCGSATERLQHHLMTSPTHRRTHQKTTPNQSSDDQSLLQSILNEIKRKNDINERRYQLMKVRHRARCAQHRETSELLNKIHRTLEGVADEEKVEMLRVLERTLEDIHK